MPSMKLKLFISATIQSIVTGYCSEPEVERLQQRQRQVVDRRARAHRDRGRGDLARRASRSGGSRSDRRAGRRPRRRRRRAGSRGRARRATAAAAARARRRRRTSRCRRRTGSDACAADARRCAGRRGPTRVREARRDRRQPERQHAGETERDQRVEAGLRHGGALRLTTRRASPPGPSARMRMTSRPRRGVVERQPHARARRARVRHLGDDAPAHERGHGEARGVARAHAHDGRVRPAGDAHGGEARARALHLHRRRAAGGPAPNSIAPMSGAPTVRA